MFKVLSYVIGAGVIGYVSYQYPLFSFVLLAALGLVVVYLVIAAVVRLVYKRFRGKWLHTPLAIISIVLIGLLIGLARPLQQPVIESGNVAEDLEYAYTMDQGDRKNLKFFLGTFRQQMKERDSIRLNQVMELKRANKIVGGIDKFHAAFILHHNPSRDSTLYRQAYGLAKEAASEPGLADDFQVQWLSKATYDRWMLSIDKEQKYNTQGGVSFEVK
ncbi:hypothetical protein [Algoriphagus sp. NG3]|uniref:hypothetical protein n=1 Tax=unclassified Algoriphagus TaxID=2641541 RepID=UPI002A7ECE1C|nr:hypothetical protein [Algoriphagus sp. NG3]WPR77361.1 hypothetical protein SLW71_08380 [Algoriphagus sp. NG3]